MERWIRSSFLAINIEKIEEPAVIVHDIDTNFTALETLHDELAEEYFARK